MPIRYRIVKRSVPVLSSSGKPAAVHDSPAVTKRDYKKITGTVFLAALLVLTLRFLRGRRAENTAAC